MIYIVATPIGNTKDISARAIECLKNADLIIAEDTRTTKKLCMRLEIETKAHWKSFHAQSSENETKNLISLIKQSSITVLLSDAGTPAISDPGVILVHAARNEGISVSPLPGACAFIAALSASGFPSNRFEFLGFLPHKKGRMTIFQEIEKSEYTMIFYESTHRIRKCVEQMHKIMPKRFLCLARELTKLHEEFLFGTPEEIIKIFETKPEKMKGEFVVLVANQKHSEKCV